MAGGGERNWTIIISTVLTSLRPCETDRQTDGQTESEHYMPRLRIVYQYSLDFLRPITTAEAFEAVDWLADLPQQTWPQAGHRSSDVILTSFC